MCIAGAICGDNHTERPWWASEQRFDCLPDKLMVTDCCLRRLPAKETVCRIRLQEFPVGGYGDYQEIAPWTSTDKDGNEYRERFNWFSFVSYYEPSWRIECNPEGEKSCKQHRRFMRGIHLREWRYEEAA